MDAFSELKGLADTADGIINKTKNYDRRLEEWFSLLKQAAVDIVSGKKITSESSNNESVDSRKLPDIVPFVSETQIVVKEKPRISSALACLRKDHIVHVKRNTPVKGSLSKTKSKSPEQHQPAFNETFVRFNVPDDNIETPTQGTSKESGDSVNGDGKQEEFYTPVGQNPELSEMQTKTGRTSRKRKSSSPLFDTASNKKVKAVNSESVSVQKKSLRKSLRTQHGKVSDTKYLKYHSRLPSSKISGSGMNSSVLKENRRVKTETEEPLKKVLAARQMKAQEAKRKREEKMQKISQQRLKLEKEKDDRLRSRKTKEVEKPLLKTVLDPKKKRTREVEKNHNSEELSEPPSAKRTRAKNTATPVNTPRKKPTEKENRVQRTQDTERNNGSEVKSDLHPTQEIKLKKTGTKKDTKVAVEVLKKSTKIIVEESATKKEDMNTTYSAKTSSPDKTEKVTTSAKVTSPVKKEIFKTPVPPQRTISSSATAKRSASVAKPNVDKSTPLATKPDSNNLSHATSSISQSYEMTPARASFVNYDVSEIKSDDSDDDEDSKRNPKPVPGWASGVRLKNALVQQQYRPIDTDEIFGNVFETPDLVEMMGHKSKRYFKRTSSAVWNSPSAFQ